MILMADKTLLDEIAQKKVDSGSGVLHPRESVTERSNNEANLLVDALATEFRTTIQSKGTGSIEDIIGSLDIQTINSLLFDEKPKRIDKPFISLIEDLLERPLYYCPDGNVCSAIQDGYLEYLKYLLERVRSLLVTGQTSEADNRNKTSTAQYLEWRLTSLIARSQLIGFIVPKVEVAGKNITDFTQNITGFRKELESFSATLSKHQNAINEQEARETRSFQNMLTTMGVFTTIVVIVMSLVITASSWLNNANSADTLIAFIVPSCIAVLSVCALTALVSEPQKKKWGRWIVISFGAITIACVTVFYCSSNGMLSLETAHHSVYGFSATDCIQEEVHLDSDGNEVISKVFNLQYFIPITTENGEVKVIPIRKSVDYDPTLIHDGYIFYCIECNKLE